ncbi:MAG TPA: nucleotide sugar dehydrogenase, partial [Bacteroidetes bacterium]|nr:nucleotide sugar dehydrogenase [Bacteroidota bacterium]
MNIKDSRIAIIGLGYVGLPLAVEFGKKFPTVGFDINKTRVAELNLGIDATLEVENEYLADVLANHSLIVSDNPETIADCNVFIVTVPTPTDKHNRPVLTPMIKASETVAKVLKAGDVVIYESTVYPGVTEEEMVPVLERESRLKFNRDFYCGYSPERINPGDKEHTVTKILKVTS